MAGTEGNQNALGNSGGKSLQDRKLAAEVRGLTLKKIKALFELPRVDMSDHDAQLHDQILVKLAGTVLPRLTEVTGEDGGPVIIDNASQTEVNNALLSFLSNGTKLAGSAPVKESGTSATPVQVPS